MTKPRKKYRPKPVLPDPVGFVINGFKRITTRQPEVMALSMSIHQAAVALTKGEAGRPEMDFLLTAANVSTKLIEQGVGEGYELVAQAGKRAVVDLVRRGWAQNHFIARGPELTAINELLELHDAQFAVITLGDLDNAVRAVIRDIRAGKAIDLEGIEHEQHVAA